jgi:RHS repeat-associated protein
VRRRFVEGRWVEIEYGNGLVRSARYSATDGLLTETTTVDAQGNEVESSFLTRDVSDGLISGLHWSAVTATNGGVDATSEESHLLTPPRGTAIDAGPRVGGFEAAASIAGADLYSYDAIGNLVGRTGVEFVHNPEHNRLLRIEAAGGTLIHEYAWDEAGFATERDGVPLEWSAAGRIVAIGGLAEFRWDALGRLVACEIAGVETRMLFGGRVGATGHGVPVAIERGEVHIDLVAGDHRFRHFDFRGNVKFVSDAEGRVMAHRGFDAYGTATLWGTDPDALGFAQGRELAGLVLLGGRLHDPAAGRFLAPDPVYPLMNPYAYALGNPVWLWDPDGRNARTALAIAAGVGVVGMAVGAAVAGAVAAGPAAAAIGLGITVFSLGFTLGVFAPATATAPAAAGGLASLAAGAGGFLAAALPLGFVVGQTVQLGILSDFGAASPPPPGRRGGKRGSRGRGGQGGGSGSLGNFDGIMIKTLELTAEIPSVGGEAPGCSPTLGARALPGRAWGVALLLPLQLMLAWRWLRRR